MKTIVKIAVESGGESFHESLFIARRLAITAGVADRLRESAAL